MTAATVDEYVVSREAVVPVEAGTFLADVAPRVVGEGLITEAHYFYPDGDLMPLFQADAVAVRAVRRIPAGRLGAIAILTHRERRAVGLLDAGDDELVDYARPRLRVRLRGLEAVARIRGQL